MAEFAGNVGGSTEEFGGRGAEMGAPELADGGRGRGEEDSAWLCCHGDMEDGNGGDGVRSLRGDGHGRGLQGRGRSRAKPRATR